MKKVELFGLEGLPKIGLDDSLGDLILASGFEFQDGDIIVVAQKVISKIEGRVVDLSTITPSQEALDLAEQSGRKPDFCQIMLNEGKVLKVKGKIVEVELPNGLVCVSAGIDKSNIDPEGKKIVLLPVDSDKSASELKTYLESKTNTKLAVIINDSLGHPNRKGSIGMAIGIAGIAALEKKEGVDLYGKKSSPTISLIDELSAATSILMGQSDEGIPVVIVRGVRYTVSNDSIMSEAVEKLQY